ISYAPNGNVLTANDNVTNQIPITSGMITISGLINPNPSVLVNNTTKLEGQYNNPYHAQGAWIAIDFGANNAQAPVQVRIYSYGINNTSNFQVQYSDEGSAWTGVATITTPLKGWNSQTWSSAGAHRYWRLYQTNSPNANYLTEIAFLNSGWS